MRFDRLFWIAKRFQYRFVIENQLNMIKYRKEPVIERLSDAKRQRLFTVEMLKLQQLFAQNSYEIRIAGGAVRDIMMDLTPTDYDFATTATPTQMKQMFEGAGIRMINMNGEKHGTITARIDDRENFEVTTLRIDRVTDGRHAEVEFTTDWLLDAFRRDLTINSMFLDFDGNVYDYFYGRDDLADNRVVFVGDASERIKADFLRILRYFRFFGRISKNGKNYDPETLKAIADNVNGLKLISGERIWIELKKILEGNYADSILETMLIKCGIRTEIGLPELLNLQEFENIRKYFKVGELNAISLLTSLLFDAQQVLELNNRLKLSAFERDLALFLIQYRSVRFDNLIEYKKLLIVDSKGNYVNFKKWIEQLLIYQNQREFFEQFRDWTLPKFPVNGKQIGDKFAIKNVKQIGRLIGRLKVEWAESDFQLDTNALLDRVPEILANQNL